MSRKRTSKEDAAMGPTDVQGRQVLAAERAAVLRAAGAPAAHERRRARRRVGFLLVALGVRLAPDAAPAEPARVARACESTAHAAVRV
jgi:hypothetical protein